MFMYSNDFLTFQIYQRFDAESIVDVDDARLAYFSQKVFPKIKDSIQGGTMIFISSYFEFVRLRNFLKSQDASFCLLGEYTKQSDISRARAWFFQEKRKIMLYTERAHFYHRYKIRGIQNLIIYSLPERKEFYPEIVNMLQGSENMTTTVLLSCFDMLRLERIVGRGPAKRMATSDKDVFIFT
ncbi:protein NUCLEOLAR FACTOR 1 [Daucus carota subsp. sativus]|uniref:protein NUCLEOLAR FACTOR 1 n=1 Tax=Daucus carota subsp. sativus TaxID=79200 RepID=UPI003083C04B